MQEKRTDEKRMNIVVGFVLVGVGFDAVLLSFSLLPGVGLLLGIPAMLIGSIFIVKSGRKLTDAGRRSEEKGETAEAGGRG